MGGFACGGLRSDGRGCRAGIAEDMGNSRGYQELAAVG